MLAVSTKPIGFKSILRGLEGGSVMWLTKYQQKIGTGDRTFKEWCLQRGLYVEAHATY